MQTIKEIESKWNVWKEIPFPSGIVDGKIAGVCLISLDTFTAGCIETFISNRGWLNGKCQSVLENSKKELNLATQKLDGNSKIYFEKLLHLTNGILRFIKIQSTLGFDSND